MKRTWTIIAGILLFAALTLNFGFKKKKKFAKITISECGCDLTEMNNHYNYNRENVPATAFVLESTPPVGFANPGNEPCPVSYCYVIKYTIP